MKVQRRDSGAYPDDILEIIKCFKYKRNFIGLIRQNFGSYADRQLIYSAYDYQSGLFSGVNRESGGSYMNSHLVPVAVIMMKINGCRDAEKIVAALGHDSIEDKKYVDFQLFSKMFTPGSAYIVQGVTKPDAQGLKKRSREYSIKVVEKVKEFGVDCVELKCDADRLHNMITLWGSIEKKKYKIWETEQYFLPMAKGFGFECAELRRAIKYQRNLLHIDDDILSR